MASATEAVRTSSPFQPDPHSAQIHKSIPILPSSSGSSMQPLPNDPMDVTPSKLPTMGPPVLSSPGADKNGSSTPSGGDMEATSNGNTGPAGGAPAATSANTQPKVVQTAFIHKLYSMLEDQSIQHLISWSSSNESFVMAPSSDFSKVLSSYFKHTNISSFVRQLNMYGFHKVSDVFHGTHPDSTLWEFRHGNGSFKRGDLMGLREIKRRASRHALIHRDSFPGPKISGPPPGTPVEPVPDPVEHRFNMMEHSLYELHNRLLRSEDAYSVMSSRCQLLTDGLMRSHQWNIELTNYILQMVPDQEHQLHRDALTMRSEIIRHSEVYRTMDDMPEPASARQPYFANISPDNGPPLSPRQVAQDDSRRPSLAANSRHGPLRPPVAPHLNISPRRYGSIGGGSNYSPSSARTPVHPPPPPPPPPIIHHPLATSVISPPGNLSRRHTSADIRIHGWQNQPPAHSPYGSGHNSAQWPSSPQRAAVGGDEQIRNALAQYEIRGSQQHGSRHATPPLPNDSGPSNNLTVDSGWTLPGARYPYNLKGIDTPGPPTRRSSMASNVHALLNPAETAERDEEGNLEDRKRKRMQ